MERHELQDLHYITPIGNVPSILQQGILSHAGASRLQHQSVAMQEMQDRRARVRVPGGRPLHEYANLYICARVGIQKTHAAARCSGLSGAVRPTIRQ